MTKRSTLLLAAIGLSVAACGVNQAVGVHVEKQRTEDAQQDVNTIRMALEQFGTDANGAYPLIGKLLPGLLQNNYLPGNRLPPNRWTDGPGILLAHDGSWTWPKDLNAIGPIANGQKTLSAVGTDLGPGHMPGDGPTDAYTYGAVLYDYAVDNQIYVIYMIGRRGDRAVVVGGSSNGSC